MVDDLSKSRPIPASILPQQPEVQYALTLYLLTPLKDQGDLSKTGIVIIVHVAVFGNS